MIGPNTEFRCAWEPESHSIEVALVTWSSPVEGFICLDVYGEHMSRNQCAALRVEDARRLAAELLRAAAEIDAKHASAGGSH